MMRSPALMNSSRRPNTGSTGSKSEMEELITSRDSSFFFDGILSMLSGINLAQGSILKAQRVLLDKIENIAARMEILEKEVKSLKKAEGLEEAEPKLQEALQAQFHEDIRGLESSLMNSPTNGTSPDIQCYETINSLYLPSNDPTWSWSGFLEDLELENQDMPTPNTPMLT